MRTSIGAWFLSGCAFLGAACSGASATGPDAAIDAAIDVAIDSESEAGSDDASIDAGACASVSPAPWPIAEGVWSTDFAPRGVAGDAPFVASVAVSGDDVYLAGRFSHAGTLAASNVAVWSAARGFRPLGAGLDAAVAGPIAVASDGSVLAWSEGADTGGLPSFVLSQFDGTRWSPIARGEGPPGPIAHDVDGALLVAGALTASDGTQSATLARWDGSAFAPIDTARGAISAVLADAQALCIGGRDAPGGYVSCRDVGGTTWVDQDLPSPSTAGPFALARDASGALLVGGAVDVDGAPRVGGVLRRVSTGWAPLGGGLTARATSAMVRSLVLPSDGTVWAIGDFDEAAAMLGVDLERTARWDGHAWSSVGTPMPAGLLAGALQGDDVLVFGGFAEVEAAAPLSALGVARWDGARWRPLDVPGVTMLGTGGVSRVAVDASCALYAGGRFLAVGDAASAHVARLEGRAWAALGSGASLPSEPHALAVAPDGTLYAGLDEGLARLHADADAWELVAGLIGEVDAIAFAPDGVAYVGGRLDPGVVAFDGATFRPVGPPDSHDVHALLLTTDGLLVAEGTRISRWDGSAWTVVAPRVAFIPRVMTAWNGHVVIGGTGGLAFLDGSRLDPVVFPEIETADIAAMAGVGEQLVVVGRRTIGASAVGLAAWSDPMGTWHPIDFDGPVDDVVALDGALVFAGPFSRVNGVPSTGLARLDAP